MTFSQYLSEVKFAASSTIEAIWSEYEEAERLQEEVDRFTEKSEGQYRRAYSIIQDPGVDLETYLMGIGDRWDTYFGPDKERYYKDQELDERKQRLATRRFLTDALASTLLQIGKQGISIVHGGIDTAPNGRRVGSQPLKEVIWQGRNQALHWEDGSFSNRVDNCFATLNIEIGGHYADYKNRNMAFDLIRDLDWTDYASFERDLLTLA